VSDAVALSVQGVSKTFGVTRALDDVFLAFRAGQITALLGENGSGKSTLIKILAGAYTPDPGHATATVRGEGVPLPLSAEQSHRLGLRFLHQDLGLVLEASIADNVALYDGFVSPSLALRRREERRRTAALLERFEVTADPDAIVADLSPSEQTMVAIARAFGDETRWPERVVVLDEPTAALPGDEVARVFRAIRRACRAGAAIILVSHRLDEVLEVGDRVAVLRDGRVVAEESLEGLGADDLIAMMLGHALVRADPDLRGGEERSHDALFRVTDLARDRVRGVSFALKAGEVLGIAGLVGSGRSELVRLLGGVQRPTAGTIGLAGETKRFSEPSEAVAAGVVTVPQNRRRDGVILEMTISENLTLGDLGAVSWKGSIRPRQERAEAQALIERFDIRPPLLALPLRLLSGGNQQKVAIARAVRLNPRVLLLDEPTQGVDVGARSEIGEIIVSLKRAGVGIVLASSDLDELLELADRVIVLDRGRVRDDLHRSEIHRDRLALALAGPELERKAA
jgi:ribose transport system ATP-binding protein